MIMSKLFLVSVTKKLDHLKQCGKGSKDKERQTGQHRREGHWNRLPERRAVCGEIRGQRPL